MANNFYFDNTYIESMLLNFKKKVEPKLEKNIKLGFRIISTWSHAQSDYVGVFVPVFEEKAVCTFTKIAKLCEAMNYCIQPSYNVGPVISNYLSRKAAGVIANRTYWDLDNNSTLLNKDLGKKANSSVKYVFNIPAYTSAVLTPMPQILPVYLHDAPFEEIEGGKSIRLVTGTYPKLFKLSNGNYSYSFGASFNPEYNRSMWAISTDSPLYNYLDKNHVVFFITSQSGEQQVLITNNLTLDAYYAVMAIALNYDANKDLLTNGCFINASDLVSLRKNLITFEKNIPADMRMEYTKYKAAVRKDFDSHIGDVSLHKYLRGELSTVTISEVVFTKDKITYQNVSIERENIGHRILESIDPSQPLDIYELVESGVKLLLNGFLNLDLNATGTGFATDKSDTVIINNIPVTLSVKAGNTRRSVNGKLINNEELIKVITHAACFNDAAEFNKFVAQVSRFSLRIHSAVSNGIVVKIAPPSEHNHFDYYGPPHPRVHPKLVCVQEAHKFYLLLNKETEEKIQIQRFVSFLEEVKQFNTKVNNRYLRDDDYGYAMSLYSRRDVTWAAAALKHLIRQYISPATALTLTEARLDTYIESLLAQHKSARKKSEELLEKVVKMTNSEACNQKGVEGYKVTGKLRTYFVEKETCKVWDFNNLGHYVCIVDARRGNMGAGFDALVARILALSNDERMAAQINTLKR